MMFDLPNAQCIRRVDVYSPTPSAEPSHPNADLEARFHEQLEQAFKTESALEPTDRDVVAAPAPASPTQDAKDQDEHGYEFRLFSKPRGRVSVSERSQDGPQRIVLRSPSPVNPEPGFLRPRRPEAYYFTGSTNDERLKEYRMAAVGGEEILKGLDVRWRGYELPWRVTVIKSSTQGKSSVAVNPADSVTKKRKRNGKKRRIAIRTKVAVRIAKQSLAKQSKAEKEAAEKEKRTRKNRAQKVKRRVKEKAKKAQVVEGPS